MINLLDKLNAILKRICHFLYARHYMGHGIHSPAVFEFASKVLFDKKFYAEYSFIEKQVKKLQNNTNFIEIEDAGAGSAIFSSTRRMIGRIARHVGTERKIGRLLFRMARYYKPHSVIELGTSVGISALYLAKGAGNKIQIQTIEASKPLIDIASESAKELECVNIMFHHGLFDDILPNINMESKGSSIVFIDGNHTFEATLRYYNFFNEKIEKGFIIFDDIYWSRSMEQAWNKIKHESVVSIDLFSAGIIVKGEMLTPGTYKIRF